MNRITYEDIKNNREVRTYIEKGDALLSVLGFTKHELGHVVKTAEIAGDILFKLGCEDREVELVKIAALMHDLGNMINRVEHAQTGAVLTFNILTRLGMDPEEIALIVAAIGNHDEGTGAPISNISAALILADKSDVRRSRVRNDDFATFDIHDRVNYAVEKSQLIVVEENRSISLDLTIDTKISSLMEYFEIFLTRMLLCKKAADFLEADFQLIMNGTKFI
ncbi:MAG: HD domain-containing protein [Clostridiaceae bacterium]|nr:HD domain-containing protein [Clostridiaceae bacterium]